jgi:hypothetical protein
MSHEPPLPDAARSPYPLQEPSLASRDDASASRKSLAAPDAEPSGDRNGGDTSLADRARETFDRVKDSKYGLGAAVGIGSAALLAALLFARRGSKPGRAPAESASRPRRADA